MEVRFKIDDKFVNKLAHILGLRNAGDVTREALTLLNWAADELKNNRIILSATPDYKDFHRLIMTSEKGKQSELIITCPKCGHKIELKIREK